MVQIGVPTETSSPSFTRISLSVPSYSEKISESTLSVPITAKSSSLLMKSPGFLSHSTILASVVDSPILGNGMLMVFIVFLSLILLIEQIFFFLSRERLQWKSFYFVSLSGVEDWKNKRLKRKARLFCMAIVLEKRHAKIKKKLCQRF